MLLAACGKGGAKGPDGDPAAVTALAKRMIDNTPAPAGVPACTPAQLVGTQLTARTLIQLAGNQMPDKPERTDWINPPELDDPAARTLVDPATDPDAKRGAAGALLAAKQFVIIRPEMVNVPLAIGVKELKRGAVGLRALVYDGKGNPTCITVFNVQNDKDVSEWAMDQTDKALVDPAISKALQQDLKKQLLAKVADLRAGNPP